MTAYQLLVVALACLAAGLGGYALLWLDAHLDDLEADERETFWQWTRGRRA